MRKERRVETNKGKIKVKRKMTREELEKGIADLDERIKNLDSIMKNKKN